MLSNNSSNNKDNNDPLPNAGNKAKNDFKDYTDNKGIILILYFLDVYTYIYL